MPGLPPFLTPRSRLLASLLAGLMLAGCGDSSEALAQKGLASLQAGDVKAAEISFKSALQEDENNAIARLELGKLYLDKHDYTSAEKELRRARASGSDKAVVDPLLARALIGMGEYQRVLDELPAPEGNSQQRIPLLLARADSQLRLGDLADATATISQAQVLAPDNADVYVALARAALADRQIEVATRRLDEALERDPKNAEALLLRGDLYRLTGDATAAADAYRQALEADPKRQEGRIALANIAINDKKYDAAIAELDRVFKAEPNNVQALLARAQIDFQKRDFEKARDRLAPVIRNLPNLMPAVLLDGAIQFALNNLQSAESQLKKYVAFDAKNLFARRLLAATLLRQGRHEDAERTLADLPLDKIPDPGIHVIAGEVAKALGKFPEASRHFEIATKLSPDNASIRTELGLARLAEGDERAMSDFRQAAELDDSNARPDAIIALKLLKESKFKEALAAVANIEKKIPNDPQVANYRAAALLGLGRFDEAYKSFEEALKRKPGFYPAAANLAQLDIKDKQYAKAQKRFESVLKINPSELRAMLAIAQLRLVQKDPAGFVKWMTEASKKNPTAFEPRVGLVRYYLSQNKTDAAFSVARAAVDAAPSSPDALELLGTVQMAAKDYPNALSNLRKMADLSPQKTNALGKLATAQIAARDISGARDTLRELLRGDPGSVAGQTLMAAMEIENGSAEAGLKIALDLQKKLPGDPAGFRIAGDAYRALRKPAEALAAYERAHAIKPASQTLIGQHLALMATNRIEEAEKRIVGWLKAHPDDHGARALLAERLLERKQFKAASEHYLALDRAVPNNIIFLNNLAWSLFELKDKRALDFAAKAQKLAPENPAILDTYGWLLANGGKPREALVPLRKANKLAPKAGEIRWHLGYALNASGDRDGARRELDALLKSGQAFPQEQEARDLRQQLGQ